MELELVHCTDKYYEDEDDPYDFTVLVKKGTSVEDCVDLFAAWLGLDPIPFVPELFHVVGRVEFLAEDAYILGIEVNTIL